MNEYPESTEQRISLEDSLSSNLTCPFDPFRMSGSSTLLTFILGTGDLGLVATSDLGSAVPYS